jgi:hypothetical protein
MSNLTNGGTIKIRITIEDQNPDHTSVYDNEVVNLSARRDFGAASDTGDLKVTVRSLVASACLAATEQYEGILQTRATIREVGETA